MLYFFNIPGLSPIGLLALFLLSLFRLGPVIFLAPFLGGKLTPVSTRIGVAIILSVAFLPTIIQYSAHEDLDFTWLFTLLAIKELFIGFVLGFFVSIPFFIAQSCGILIDYLRGASIMQAQDPTMQNQSSSIGNLFNYILIVLFFQIDGPLKFFDIFIKSYEIIPAEAFLSSKYFNMNMLLWKHGADLINKITALSIQLAAPALVAVLMAEMFLGIANRLAPQVQIAFLGMSLKSLVGLLVLWAGWFFILKQTSIVAENWLEMLSNIVMSMKPYKVLSP